MTKAEEILNKHLIKVLQKNYVERNGTAYKACLEAVNEALSLSSVSCSEITDSDLGKDFVVINRIHGHEFKLGSVVRLEEIDIEDDGFSFVDSTGDWWMLKADEVKRKEE